MIPTTKRCSECGRNIIVYYPRHWKWRIMCRQCARRDDGGVVFSIIAGIVLSFGVLVVYVVFAGLVSRF